MMISIKRFYAIFAILLLTMSFSGSADAQLFVDFNYSINKPFGKYAETQRFPPIYGDMESGSGYSVYAGYFHTKYFAFTFAYKSFQNALDVSDKLNTLHKQYSKEYLIDAISGNNTIKAYLGGVSYVYPLNKFEFTTRALVGSASIGLPEISAIVQKRSDRKTYEEYAEFDSGKERGIAGNLSFDVSYALTDNFFIYLGAGLLSTSATVSRNTVQYDELVNGLTQFSLKLDQRVTVYDASVGLRVKF